MSGGQANLRRCTGVDRVYVGVPKCPRRYADTVHWRRWMTSVYTAAALQPPCTCVATLVSPFTTQAPDGCTLAMKLSVLTVEDQRGVHHEVTGGEGVEVWGQVELMRGQGSIPSTRQRA